MAYNTLLASRIRERFALLSPVAEKEMMGGIVFMYHDKMCAGVLGDELLCRIAPDAMAAALKHPGCREMRFNGPPMKNYVLVSEAVLDRDSDFDHWIGLALQFNPLAKASRKPKKHQRGESPLQDFQNKLTLKP
jgi:TfoX/Sxy family transcriptional regulator of competence genes